MNQPDDKRELTDDEAREVTERTLAWHRENMERIERKPDDALAVAFGQLIDELVTAAVHFNHGDVRGGHLHLGHASISFAEVQTRAPVVAGARRLQSNQRRRRRPARQVV